jgi:hypothetical protein
VATVTTRDSASGTTLVELLVAIALTSVAILVASALIVQSIRVVEGTSRTLRDSSTVRAKARLRSDIQMSRSADVISVGWTEGPLRLGLAAGGQVVWQRRGRFLDRLGADGGRSAQARGLTGWRWRSLSNDVLEIELRVRVGDDERVEDLAFALRGGDHGRSW